MHFLSPLLVPLLATSLAQEGWTPLDDPDGAALPVGLSSLPAFVGQAYVSHSGHAILIARHLEGDSIVDAFMDDEEALSGHCEFIPVGERLLELSGEEGMVFECELSFGAKAGRAAALYAPRASTGLVSLWALGPGEPSFEDLAQTLEELLPHFRETVEPVHRARHLAIVQDHEISFGLTDDLEGAFALAPAEKERDEDFEFFKLTLDNHASFKGDSVRAWADPERGVSLSYQVVRGDRALGPKESLVVHVALELQLHERVSKEDGDIPVELVHMEGARTVVVSEAEVQRHYTNNRLATDGGVILGTILRRSPFAEATRLSWTEGAGEETEHVFALYVELRAYPRSSSETVTRSMLVMLQGRAKNAADLARLESGLAFESRPLELPTPFTSAR